MLKGVAEDEIRLAREGGYDVPAELAALPAELGAMFDAARKGWTGGGATEAQVLSPTDELDLHLEFERASEIINSMRARRYADIARALRQQEEELRKANDEKMAQLQKALAEKRKQAFDANDHGVLDDVSEALGSAARAIDDTRAAAGIISDRVDQVNAVVSMISKGGKEAIDLPELPEGLQGAVDWIEKANEKIKFVIDVLDLVGPGQDRPRRRPQVPQGRQDVPATTLAASRPTRSSRSMSAATCRPGSGPLHGVHRHHRPDRVLREPVARSRPARAPASATGAWNPVARRCTCSSRRSTGWAARHP